jgi:hypothetical protein
MWRTRLRVSAEKVLVAVLAACTFAVVGPSARSEDITLPVGQKGVYSVADFGAKGDGVTDDTAAFQKALDAAAKDGGGIVFVPTGEFLIKGHLNVPMHVTLEGTLRSPGTLGSFKGSKLLAVEGRGSEKGEPFIFLNSAATVKGLIIYYPEQDRKKPVPYPWCIAGAEYDCSVIDVMMVNPWNGINFGMRGNGRHMIRNVYGQPLNIGIFVDHCFDVGRIQNVHFWPFWEGELMKYTQENSTAFKFVRTDWQYVDNCFCICYKVGFQFSNGASGPGNAVISNSGADGCPTAVLVEKVQPHAGVSFVNCQFMGVAVVTETNTGPVKLANCGFWGGKGPYLDLKGLGTVTVTGCHFNKHPGDDPVIRADCRRLNVSGCDFMDDGKTQVELGPHVYGATIVGNNLRGGAKVVNNTKEGKVEIGLNSE